MTPESLEKGKSLQAEIEYLKGLVTHLRTAGKMDCIDHDAEPIVKLYGFEDMGMRHYIGADCPASIREQLRKIMDAEFSKYLWDMLGTYTNLISEKQLEFDAL